MSLTGIEMKPDPKAKSKNSNQRYGESGKETQHHTEWLERSPPPKEALLIYTGFHPCSHSHMLIRERWGERFILTG